MEFDAVALAPAGNPSDLGGGGQGSGLVRAEGANAGASREIGTLKESLAGAGRDIAALRESVAAAQAKINELKTPQTRSQGR